jgi:hypothetical protein
MRPNGPFLGWKNSTLGGGGEQRSYESVIIIVPADVDWAAMCDLGADPRRQA